MRDPVIEVRPAVDLDKLAREARAVNIEIADGERLVSATTNKLEQRRARLGKILIEARKAFPRSGPKAAGWGKFLGEIGIGDDSALRYMGLAGFIESSPAHCGESSSRVPTYREAGIIKSTAEDGAPVTREVSIVAAGRPLFEGSGDAVEEIGRVAEAMQRSARSLFGYAEQLEALCQQHGSTVRSPAMLTIAGMLIAARGSIHSALKLVQGDKHGNAA